MFDEKTVDDVVFWITSTCEAVASSRRIEAQIVRLVATHHFLLEVPAQGLRRGLIQNPHTTPGPRTIIAWRSESTGMRRARDIGAFLRRESLQLSLAVDRHEPHSSLTPEERTLRNRT